LSAIFQPYLRVNLLNLFVRKLNALRSFFQRAVSLL
jgi:hypothetical protein